MSTATYIGKGNQSIFDICLNTYGTIDLLGKLIKENGVGTTTTPIYTGAKITYETSLVANEALNAQNNIYATAESENMAITDKTRSIALKVGTDIANGNTFAISALENAEVLMVFVGGSQVQDSNTEGYSFNKTTGTLDFTVIGGLSNIWLNVLYNEA